MYHNLTRLKEKWTYSIDNDAQMLLKVARVEKRGLVVKRNVL